MQHCGMLSRAMAARQGNMLTEESACVGPRKRRGRRRAHRRRQQAKQEATDNDSMYIKPESSPRAFYRGRRNATSMPVDLDIMAQLAAIASNAANEDAATEPVAATASHAADEEAGESSSAESEGSSAGGPLGGAGAARAAQARLRTRSVQAPELRPVSPNKQAKATAERLRRASVAMDLSDMQAALAAAKQLVSEDYDGTTELRDSIAQTLKARCSPPRRRPAARALGYAPSHSRTESRERAQKPRHDTAQPLLPGAGARRRATNEDGAA